MKAIEYGRCYLDGGLKIADEVIVGKVKSMTVINKNNAKGVKVEESNIIDMDDKGIFIIPRDEVTEYISGNSLVKDLPVEYKLDQWLSLTPIKLSDTKIDINRKLSLSYKHVSLCDHSDNHYILNDFTKINILTSTPLFKNDTNNIYIEHDGRLIDISNEPLYFR